MQIIRQLCCEATNSIEGVSKLQSITIDVIHYNRKRERIDIMSDESREKIREAVFYIINNKIQG